VWAGRAGIYLLHLLHLHPEVDDGGRPLRSSAAMYDPNLLVKLAVGLGLGLVIGTLGCNRLSANGCAKDSDCKGDRVCVAGECTDPHAASFKPNELGQGRTGTVAPPAAFKHAIVRASPALNAPEVAQLPTGTQVDLVDTSPDTRWFQIRCAALGNRTAWIHRDVVRTP